MVTARYISILVLLICISSIGIVSAQVYSISAETGETYIQWRWHPTNSSNGTSPVDIYLTDSLTPITTNFTGTTYLVAHLKPGERHNIALYNSTARLNGDPPQLLVKASTMTLKQAFEVYFLLAACVIMMLSLIIFMRDTVKLLLIAIFDIILCLFGISISVNRGMIPFLFIGIAVISGIILIIKGLPNLREDINWW